MIVAALWQGLGGQDWDARREAMVRTQMEARDIRDAAVLRAIRATPRHLFVPDSFRHSAYEDRPLPIGHGQTISQPYIVASMTQLLGVRASDRVLEIGTGSGYQAAVLGRLAARVYTIEIVEPLGREAAERLKQMGFRNIETRIGDGYAGWPEQAPFDRIILTAAPSEIPQVLLNQLRPGGRLVAPVGETYSQDLVVIDKDAQGKLTRRREYAVQFVPMVRR
jgi:protein-L-isoaspartate(D-aspartate) O-methyltransferase